MPVWSKWGVVLMLAMGSPWAAAQTLTGQQILEKISETAKVADSRYDMSMTLTNQAGQVRVRKLLALTRLKSNGIDNMRVMRFQQPADVKGTATLLVENASGVDDLWIYLPALKKTRRLVSNNKRDAFVGSDITFGDILGHRTSDWMTGPVHEEDYEGRPVFVVEALAKNRQVAEDTGYSKRLLWVGKESFVALKTEYWDESGLPLKTIFTQDVRLVDSARRKFQFMRLLGENTQTGHKTVLLLENFRVNQGIAENVFSTRSLEQDE